MNIEKRTCPQCGEEKPLNEKSFPKKGEKWFLRKCRVCVNKRRLATLTKWRKEHGRLKYNTAVRKWTKKNGKKLYQKHLARFNKLSPEKQAIIRAKNKECIRKYTERLPPRYIAKVLRLTHIKDSNLIKELIEVKTLHIKLLRAINERKQNKYGNEIAFEA